MDKHLSKGNDDVDCCKKSLIEIKKKLPEILENPIMKDFLEEEENKKVFYKAIESQAESEIMNLDLKFKNFYRLNRISRYLTGLIKRYPIDYDKRVKLRNHRYQLIFDKPVTNGRDETNVSMGDLFAKEEKTPYERLELKDNLNKKFFVTEDPILYKAIEELEEKQIEILYLKYKLGYNNKEIGEIFGQTEQNISYWHKKTINQLKKKMA